MRKLIRAILYILGYYNIEGVTHFDTHNTKIIISNHTSFLDGFILFACLNIDFKVLISHDFANVPILSKAVKNMGGVFINTNINTNTVISYVIESGPLLIFPEGFAKKSEHLYEFKPGAFRQLGAVAALELQYSNTYCKEGRMDCV